MNYDSIPDALQTRLRISILSAIYSGKKDFNTLKELLSTTDGNLSVQLTKLEQYGYLASEKIIEGRKKRTLYAITAHGKQMFAEYVELLSRSIQG